MDSSAHEMGKAPRIEVIGLTGMPEVQPGDTLGELIATAAAGQDTPVEHGDILVVAQKIVSKAEGRLVSLSTVEPSPFARRFAAESDRDPRMIELVLRESRSVVRSDPARGILITETRHGIVCANAGIDTSNVPGEDVVSLLPEDPDASARGIREEVGRATHGGAPAVIVSDTLGRAWREGHANFAIGVAGMDAIRDYRGSRDAAGKLLKVTMMAVADELASAAELVMAKAAGIPVAIIRGYAYRPGEGGLRQLLRDRSKDLFR